MAFFLDGFGVVWMDEGGRERRGEGWRDGGMNKEMDGDVR